MATYVAVISVVKLNDDDRILLLKRNARRRTSPNKWQTPSGFLNEGESAEEAALREVKEETSLDGTNLEGWWYFGGVRLMGKVGYHPIPNFSQIRQGYY